MKGQTFGQLFPAGTCFICRQVCQPDAIAHYECAIAYSDEKQRLAREREK